MSDVPNIYQALADNARRARERQGEIRSQALAGIATSVKQIFADRETARRLARDDARDNELLGFKRDANTRDQADQTRKDTAEKAALENKRVLNEAVKAGFDLETHQVNLGQSVNKLVELNRLDLMENLRAAHKSSQDEIQLLNPGQVGFNKTTNQLVPGMSAPEKKPDYTIDGQRFSGGDATPIGPAVAPRLTFSAPQPVMRNGQRILVRAGSDGAIYDVNQRKIEGGGLSPDVPPTVRDRDNEPLIAVMDPVTNKPVLRRRSQAEGMAPASTREQGRPVTSGDAGRIGEIDNSLDDLDRLGKAVGGMGDTGTVAKVGASMPNWVTDLTGWGTDAKKKQALIDRVKQVIGKTLEGGVLRKEDEVKYEKILPTIADINAVVVSKLAGLDAAMRTKRERTIEALGDAGYDVSRFERTEKKTAAPTDGTEGVVNGRPAVWKTVNGKTGWYAR